MNVCVNIKNIHIQHNAIDVCDPWDCIWDINKQSWVHEEISTRSVFQYSEDEEENEDVNAEISSGNFYGFEESALATAAPNARQVAGLVQEVEGSLINQETLAHRQTPDEFDDGDK